MAAARKPSAAKAAGAVLHTVSIRTKAPHPRRWRAGLCFTAEPRVEQVSAAVLAQLKADPLLVIEPVVIEPAVIDQATDATP